VSIVIVILGFVLVAAAFLGDKFYSADIWGGSISNEQVPKWLGRLGFISIGMFLIVCGVASLVAGH